MILSVDRVTDQDRVALLALERVLKIERQIALEQRLIELELLWVEEAIVHAAQFHRAHQRGDGIGAVIVLDIEQAQIQEFWDGGVGERSVVRFDPEQLVDQRLLLMGALSGGSFRGIIGNSEGEEEESECHPLKHVHEFLVNQHGGSS